MLTDEEALEVAVKRSSGLEYLSSVDAYSAGFHAALAWLRSQGVPVAYIDGDELANLRGDGAAPVVGVSDRRRKVPLYLAPQPAIPDGWQSKASRDVLAERRRQVEAEGWTPEHDDAHGDGSMCIAAVCYAEWDHYEHPNSDGDGLIPINWPWSAKWWKPRDRRRNLVKAAALLLAEIERLDRASAVAPEPKSC